MSRREAVAIAIFGVWRRFGNPPTEPIDQVWRERMTDDLRKVWLDCADAAIAAQGRSSWPPSSKLPPC